MFGSMIEKAVHKSQHCQRNWDLSKSIPEEDLQVLETSITACPSKQNYVLYQPWMITHRETIDKIYHATDGFMLPDGTSKTNSQTLANLLVVFVESEDYWDQLPRNKEVLESKQSGKEHASVNVQRNLAIGIASGYLNLTASLLGYSTGCCTCFNGHDIKRILKISKEPRLLMGVGIPDKTRSRRQHHKEKDFYFPTFNKEMKAIRIVD